MVILSVGVIIYQIIIFIIITASGKGGRWIVTPIACLWTITHVFFPPLMILQFCVIALAFACAGV